MIVSCDESLIELQAYLTQLGYRVFGIVENVPSDVYIYSEDNLGLLNFTNKITPVENGSLLINADGKTHKEIEFEIKNRVYSSLF